MGKGEAHLCSSDGFTNQVRNGGVCVRHGAKRKRWSNDGCTNSAEIRGVCMGQRANYAAVMDVQIKSIREECVLGMGQSTNYAAVMIPWTARDNVHMISSCGHNHTRLPADPDALFKV
eukprot:scaffold4425_cov153-Skeletonema_marinoi.AAC.4